MWHRLRDVTQDGLTAAQIKVVPEGAVLQASGEPVQAEGRTWRKVRDAEGASGWVAAEFLGT